VRGCVQRPQQSPTGTPMLSGNVGIKSASESAFGLESSSIRYLRGWLLNEILETVQSELLEDLPLHKKKKYNMPQQNTITFPQFPSHWPYRVSALEISSLNSIRIHGSDNYIINYVVSKPLQLSDTIILAQLFWKFPLTFPILNRVISLRTNTHTNLSVSEGPTKHVTLVLYKF
jgi:hypothetical protein